MILDYANEKSVHINGAIDMMAETGRVFQPGDLVKIMTNYTASSDGLTVAPACSDGGITIYSKIDLESYPSCNDFMDPGINCYPGQTANIVRFVGRPIQIQTNDKFWEYDVYEILVNGFSAQVFAINLKLIMNA